MTERRGKYLLERALARASLRRRAEFSAHRLSLNPMSYFVPLGSILTGNRSALPDFCMLRWEKVESPQTAPPPLVGDNNPVVLDNPVAARANRVAVTSPAAEVAR